MGHIPSEPEKMEGSIVQFPWVWCGEVALDGTIQPWLSAPLGSLYVRVDSGNVSYRIKTADNSASADWLTVTVS